MASAAGIGVLGAFGSVSIFGALVYGAVLVATVAVWTAGVPALLVLSTLDGFVKHFAPDAPGVYVIKDILLAAVLLGMLIHVALHRERYAHMRWYALLPWALFVAYMASQIVHPPFGFTGSVAGFRARAFFALLYVVGAIYFVRRDRLIPIANLVIALAVFAAAAGILQHAMGAAWMRLGPGFATASLHYTTFIPNGDPSLTQEARLAFRSYGTLVDPASLGLFCSLGMLFAMAALSRTTSKRVRGVLFASMGVIAIGLFYTGTRAAMIGLGIGILVIFGFMVAERRMRVSTLIGLLLIAGVGSAAILTTRSALTDRTTSSASVAYALQTRTRSNTIVLDEVGQYPLGHGLGSTGAGGALRKEPGLAIDNTFLAYTYETGPIGLAIFLLAQFTFMGLAVRAALAQTPYHSVFIGFVAAQCALLIAGLATQGTFDYAPLAQIFWLFCGALALPWNREAVGVNA
jgi:uncharacterized membrane protein YciS (DUF1049 family)